MDVLVPFAPREPKTRLAGLLDLDERTTIARELLYDVLDVLSSTGYEPTVLSTDPFECDASVIVDDRSLTDAVNAHLDAPTAVVMADLGLVTTDALERLFDTDGDVVIAPGLGGGTNALVVRHDEFTVDYHGASIRDHRHRAADVGATVEEVDSFRLALDVDEPDDLVEVLLHSDGRAAAWLESAGFTLDTRRGRVTLSR